MVCKGLGSFSWQAHDLKPPGMSVLETLTTAHTIKFPTLHGARRLISVILNPPLNPVLGHLNPLHIIPNCFKRYYIEASVVQVKVTMFCDDVPCILIEIDRCFSLLPPSSGR
jgi:hypothetical protein